ncbi:putative DNA-binding regulatory protein [Myxococcus stipitatus DSM 14675]|uniref:Putative DNA-binding regulatory protein n=1 Tax=Myxococcus stipitatus (strain DSM 14675 / JCM 12634 / Mx s8) TaxID=1278073 RepID=L7TZL9_MYXSD|nr:sigma-70 family RNA polymerase sigma factor [Myxococcus stipitatus]AGC41418.1 putative DNA-binding regulatory protein [Myxococcus stipitatus DSM 14675]
MHRSRFHSFVQHWPASAMSGVDESLLEALLTSWVSTGRQAWPEVALAEEDFLRHLAQRLVPGDVSSLTSEEVPVADLYLACACARGLPAAHAALERHFLSKVARAVSRVRGGGVDAEEVLQQLRQRLLTAEGRTEPRIAEYRGTAPLSAWLRAAAVRTALNLQRAEGRRARVEQEAEGAVLGGDVELDYLRRRHHQDFREALVVAVASLSPRERTVLRLHVVEGVNLERIGAMYRTHKSTVSRWVAHARQTLLARVRESLAERLQLSLGELNSLMLAVGGQLDLSLPGLLRESA